VSKVKICSNPDCESSFLYGNDKTVCPFCRCPLTASTVGDHQQPLVLPADRFALEELPCNENGDFFRYHFGGIECRGRISEIDHQQRFNSRLHKLFISVIRGEPFQLAHQTIEYTIRVENISDGFPTEITDFCMYGNFLGRMQVGDEVVVKAKHSRDRRVVKSVYNETTSSVVKPGLQISAGVIRVILALIALIVVSLIYGIVWLFKSGAILVRLTAIMPLIIIVFGFWLILRSVFSRRRRRRRWLK